MWHCKFECFPKNQDAHDSVRFIPEELQKNSGCAKHSFPGSILVIKKNGDFQKSIIVSKTFTEGFKIYDILLFRMDILLSNKLNVHYNRIPTKNLDCWGVYKRSDLKNHPHLCEATMSTKEFIILVSLCCEVAPFFFEVISSTHTVNALKWQLI